MLFRSGIPAHLRGQAFSCRFRQWPAWEQAAAREVVNYLRSTEYAVVNGVLVVRTANDFVHTHYATIGGDYFYNFNVDPCETEPWSAFVQRSADEAVSWLDDFRPLEPINDGDPYVLGFSLIWFQEKEYRSWLISVTPQGEAVTGGPAQIRHLKKPQQVLYTPAAGENGMTELHFATYAGDLARVESCIQAGYDRAIAEVATTHDSR